jgi:hypothetical protein
MALNFSDILVNLTGPLVNTSLASTLHTSFSSPPEVSSFLSDQDLPIQTSLDAMSKRIHDREGMIVLQNLAEAFKSCTNKLLTGVMANWQKKWLAPAIGFLYTPIKVAQNKFPELKIFQGKNKAS